MSEASQRKNLVKKLATLDAVSIESHMTGIGIPDVNYIGGWIELKWLRAWPKGADKNPVRFDHTLSQEQKVWRKRRILRGGVALVGIQVSHSWFFYKSLEINNWFDNMTRPQMVERADYYDNNGLDANRLINWLEGLPCREKRESLLTF